jgi:hypothetical protein
MVQCLPGQYVVPRVRFEKIPNQTTAQRVTQALTGAKRPDRALMQHPDLTNQLEAALAYGWPQISNSGQP